MTQAVTNIYNNLNEALMKDTSVVSAVTKPADFTKVLDKKIDAENVSMTIGDMKSASNSNITNIMSDLQETITNATNEANMENSLDLTLARDIKDIIKQLRSSLNINIEDAETEEKEISEQSDEIVISETENAEAEEAEDAETDTLKEKDNKAFEQILSAAVQIIAPQLEPVTSEIVEKAGEFASKMLSKADLKIDTEAFGQKTIDLATKTLSETVMKEVEETADDTTDSVLDRELFKELNIESIEAEANTNGEGEFFNQQSAEEYGIKAMIQHTAEAANVNFDKIQTQAVQQAVQPKAVEVTPEKIIDQIVKHMENMRNGSKVNIVLNPESLGRVNLQIINTKEGLSAQFTVATQEARDLIMKGLDGLKETLLAHGVGVDNISVKVSETEKEAYNQDWTEQEGSRGGNKEQGHQNREEKEKGLFEKTMAMTFKKNGNV